MPFNGPGDPQNYPSPWEIWSPSNTRFLGPAWVSSSHSAVFGQLTRVTNTHRHTDLATCDICNSRPHVMHLMQAMRPKNVGLTSNLYAFMCSFIFLLAYIYHSFNPGHGQTASSLFAGGSEVSDYSLDGKQQKQQSSKNRHSVNDWCEQKQTCRQVLTIISIFKNSLRKLRNNFEMHYFHFFLTVENQTFLHLVIFASSQSKRTQTMSIFSTQKKTFPPFLLTASKSSLL